MLLAKEGDLKRVREVYETSLSITKELAAKDPDDIQLQRDLSASHEKRPPLTNSLLNAAPIAPAFGGDYRDNGCRLVASHCPASVDPGWSADAELIVVSHEAVRRWALEFGRGSRTNPARLPRADDKWHLYEVVIKIAGTTHWLWRERQMKRLAARQAQQFLAAHEPINNLLSPPRSRHRRPGPSRSHTRAFDVWAVVTAAAVAV